MESRGTTGARRLAVVAGALAAVGAALIPYAGGAGERPDGLATVDERPAPAAAWSPDPSPPASLPDVGQVRTVAPALAADDPAPPPPPPPPPAPPGAEVDPSVGVVPGEGTDGAGPGAPGGTTAPPPPPAPATDTEAAAPGERVWAVVVGIDDYPGRASDLRAATADARDLVAGLLRLGVPADHVRSVYDGDATILGLLAAVDWLVAHAGPDDTAVFFFAGHVRELGGGTEAIVTADAGWVADWFLAERLRGLAARDAWFVLAACYGGGFDELLGPGRVLTAGAGPGELAFESDAYGRSYLAEFVLRRGLLGGEAGPPTVQGVVAWAADQLAGAHPDRQLWHRDEAGHVVSLDGVRRDGSVDPPPRPAPPRPRPRGLLPGLEDANGCLLGLLCG